MSHHMNVTAKDSALIIIKTDVLCRLASANGHDDPSNFYHFFCSSGIGGMFASRR